MSLQVALWLGGMVVVLGVIWRLATRKRGSQLGDLGPISDQWIADHRSHSDESH